MNAFTHPTGLPGSTIGISGMTGQTTNLSKEPGAVHAPPNEVTSRSIVDPLRRKDFATVWLSLHSTSLCKYCRMEARVPQLVGTRPAEIGT
jgi:hypothetical protein